MPILKYLSNEKIIRMTFTRKDYTDITPSELSNEEISILGDEFEDFEQFRVLVNISTQEILELKALN